MASDGASKETSLAVTDRAVKITQGVQLMVGVTRVQKVGFGNSGVKKESSSVSDSHRVVDLLLMLC